MPLIYCVVMLDELRPTFNDRIYENGKAGLEAGRAVGILELGRRFVG